MTLNLPDLNKPVMVTCPVTRKQIERDKSHRFGVAFVHYTEKDGKMAHSHAQIFNTLHCADRPSALKAIKKRIDDHHTVPFGSYDPAIHNPTGETDHDTCHLNVSYDRDSGGLTRAQLPTECAICGESITDRDVYVPKVDDSTNGHQYQDYLQSIYPNASLEQCTLGACSMEHAQQLAHAILDQIIEPYHAAKQAALAKADAAAETEQP